MNKRSKDRITKSGMLFERRLVALRRIQAQTPRPIDHRPSVEEATTAKQRWFNLRHKI